MSDAKEFLTALFGGSLPNGVRVGSIQELIDSLGDQCEADDCPFHGERNQARKEADDELSRFTSKDLFDMALGATAGAEQALRAGRYQVAEARQTQASLWMELQERLDREETIERRLAAVRTEVTESWRAAVTDSEELVRNLRNQVSDADDDKAELRDELEREREAAKTQGRLAKERQETIEQLENAIKDSNGA